jgi:hypothetical protein
MRLQPFVATAFSLLGAVVVSPSFAQDQRPPSDSKPAEVEKIPADRPATPPPSPDTPAAPDGAQTVPPPSDQGPLPSDQAPPPPQDIPRPPPEVAPMPGVDLEPSAEASSNAMSIDGFESFVPPPGDQVPRAIGEKLSPLLVTVGFGLGYAAIKHPDLESRSLNGSFVELTAGSELSHRFRLSFAATSFQTTIHLAPSGGWAEGDLPIKTAPGFGALAASPVPGGYTSGGGGGVVVQKTLHVHSFGPRLDFLPLGTQGPYIGLTTGLGVIQDIGLRAGGSVGLRVGGEWRPYHVFGVGIEAGAHGQIYTDSRAAIPYATARLQFYLDPEQLSSRPSPTVRTFVPSGQRTLPVLPTP